MLARSTVRILALLFFFGVSFSAGAAEPFVEVEPYVSSPGRAGVAWWLRARYNPTGQTVAGIPVGTIDKQWCAANVFSLDLFPKELAADFNEPFKEYGFNFSASGYKAGPHRNLEAMVGVVRNCKTQAVDNFLLILKRDKNKPPRVVYRERFQFSETGQLAILKKHDGNLTIVWCLSCDHGQTLAWRQGKLVWLPEEERD